MISVIEIAVGCIMCGKCSTGECPVGICTQGPELRKRLGGGKDIGRAVEWITNFLKVTTKEIVQLTATLSYKGINLLSKEYLRVLTVGVSTMIGVKLVGLDY
ncbi:MAG: hypothetical protein DRN53_08430 [Thermoprotei archaeon]|nr:MAG: hypothetical protein DRN53_08430 [Thermoprotei archaeon]